MRISQVSHVFIFALGIIIVALILFFGYKVVKELRGKEEETSVARFKAKLVNDIKILKEGDVTLKSYIIPKSYREVCFVDKTDHTTNGAIWVPESFDVNQPLVSSAIEDKVREDVFLVGEDKFDSMFVGNIDLGINSEANPYAVYCFEIKRSKLSIMLTGQGNSVLIQKPE